MESKQYTSGPSSCRVRQCTALPAHMRERTREVLSVFTPPARRGEGHASDLMKKVCSEADRHFITLVLFVNPFEPSGEVEYHELKHEMLVNWYSTYFGFAVIQKAPVVMMARAPGSTPRILSLTEVNAVIKETVAKHVR
jgi:predicted GNAT family acetyltransferase